MVPPNLGPRPAPMFRPPTSSSYASSPDSYSGGPGRANSRASSIRPVRNPHPLPPTPATPAYSTGTTSISGRRSRAASSIGASEGNQVICAVSEARGVVPSVGVALINISTGEAVLSQICDNQSYVKTTHKLAVFEPSRILIVATACPPNPKSSLYATIEEELPGVPIVPLNRSYWSETAGLEFIQDLAFKEDVEATKVAIQGNYYATSSFSAVCLLAMFLVSTTHADMCTYRLWNISRWSSPSGSPATHSESSTSHQKNP